LVFVLDESGSIRHNNFQTVKTFVYNFTSNLLSDTTANRVGIITFSDTGQVYIALNSTIKKDELLENITNLPYNGRTTNTASGLDLMRQQEWRNETSIFRLAVVVTDGKSNNNTATLNSAMEVHDHEPPIVVYAIGIGGNIDRDELLAIASGVELFTNLSSFDENVLDSTRDGYTYQICFTGKSILGPAISAAWVWMIRMDSL
jgi:Mg-chelatase subunit ChlD